MTISFEIDEEMVIKAAEEAVTDALKFSGDMYSHRSAFHKSIQKQVTEQLASPEVKEKVAQVAAERIDGIITDIVTQELKLHIKKSVRKMREDGDLAGMMKTYLGNE